MYINNIMSKKLFPILCGKSLYKIGQDFLDRRYMYIFSRQKQKWD